ncbi:hypothetical protein WA556_003628 [Blastocystis sp. ATCC 50177/Nand II]
MGSMERRLVALQETVLHTLEDCAALWLATEAEARQARRSEGDGVRSLEGVEQTAMRCKSALPRGRSECTHSHARGIVVNGAMIRPTPTRQEEATTSRLKRLGMRPTGFSSKDTDTHRPSVHAQAREARPIQSLTHLAPAPVLAPLPELPPHTAPAPSPLSGIGKDSATAARIVAGSRRNEPVRSRRRQRVRRYLAAHHARVASSVRLSVNSLLAWISLGEVEGATKQVGERSYTSADILVCRRQGLNTPCTLLSCGTSIPMKPLGEAIGPAEATQERVGPHEVCSARGSVALKPWGFSQSMT